MRTTAGFAGRPTAGRALVAVLLAVLVGCQAETPPPSAPASTSTPAPALATPTPASPAPSGEAAVESPSPGDGTGTGAEPENLPGPIPTAEPREPGSRERILAALAEGRIDEPTALLYRVYALFGDTRLPAEFVTDRFEEDAGALAAAALGLETLPPAIAEELRPFLARPTDPVSVWHDVGEATGREPIAAAPPDVDGGADVVRARTAYLRVDFVCEADGWGYVAHRPLLGNPAWKVWTGCGDEPGIDWAVKVAGYLDTYYGPEVALLGPPVRDRGGPNEAGDGPLDVYLVNQCMARSGRCMGSSFAVADRGSIAYTAPATPYVGAAGARGASAYIVFKRSFMGPTTESTVVHELFHALQMAHNAEGTIERNTFSWFLDASAKWAEHFFVPSGRAAKVYPWLSSHQTTSQGLNDETNTNAYSSWTWPLFMQQKGSERTIAGAWRAIEGKRGWRNVDAAIASVVPFDTQLREAQVRLWNEPFNPANPDPIQPRFQAIDPQLPETGPGGGRYGVWDVLLANPPGTAPRRMPERMPALSGRYTQFHLDPNIHKVILDFSTLDPASQVDVDLLLNIKGAGKGWERRKLPTGKTTLCIDAPNDAAKDLIIVLTNHDMDPARPVSGFWTVESLKEPCMGFQIHIEWTDEYAGVKDTIVFDGEADTLEPGPPVEPGQPEPPAFVTGTGTATGRRAGWKACNPGIADTPAGSGTATFGATVIEDRVFVSAFADIDNPLLGVSTGVFELPVEGGKVDIPRVNPVGDPCPHTSYGKATVTLAPPSP